jgi:signal peptidase
MRSSPALSVVSRSPRFAHLRAAFERTNKPAGVALAILVCLFWAQYLRPQAFGGRAGYVLVSGESMLPHYRTGDLVLVEKQSSYHIGELIAYRVPKGDAMAGAQVIHRIIGGNAQTGFIVQGDNRTAPDVWRPKLGDIVGAKALHIPNAVVVLQFLKSPLFLGLLAACFVFVRVLTRDDEEIEAVDEDEDNDASLRPAA